MPRFRKKPVEIEAIQNEGEWGPIVKWLQFIKSSYFVFKPGEQPPITRNDDGSLNIVTLEGVMRADVGDWVIQGVKGEIYPCKPDIFAATYDPV
jgi:hypothetical protein